MSHLAVLVDEQDKVIGHKGRFELEKGDIIRITALWIENSEGQILLAQRSFKKKNDPGVWGPAAAGTVEVDDTYEENVYKEAEEEIGLTGTKLIEFNKIIYWRPDGIGRFAAWFKATVDWPVEKFILQETEVEKIAWFDKQQIISNIKENPDKFVPSAVHWHDLGLL